MDWPHTLILFVPPSVPGTPPPIRHDDRHVCERSRMEGLKRTFHKHLRPEETTASARQHRTLSVFMYLSPSALGGQGCLPG